VSQQAIKQCLVSHNFKSPVSTVKFLEVPAVQTYRPKATIKETY